MYTSCPECGTVFRITITELRVAEGHARCGHCSATFNAVATLSDEAPIDEPVATREPEPEPAAAPAPTPAPLEGAPPAGVDAVSRGDDDTMEFDIPKHSWSNFFEDQASPRGRQDPVIAAVPPGPVDGQVDGPEVAPESGDAHPESSERDVGDDIGSATVDQVGLYRALAADPSDFNLDDDADWQALLEEVQEDDDEPEEVYVIEADPSTPELPEPSDLPSDPSPGLPTEATPDSLPDSEPEWPWDEPAAEPDWTPAPLPADFVASLGRVASLGSADRATDLPGDRVGDDEDQAAPEMPGRPMADRPFVWTPPAAAAGEPGRRPVYAVLSALLFAGLLIQALHQWRGELATYPALTAPLQRLYDALGIPLWPAWSLQAYEVRNYEAIADRSSRGALDILARIAVVDSEPVGLPLVRVTLNDRFGEPLGSRVFAPAEYLREKPLPREPLSPGTLIPVEISLKDPGNEAQGVDVDICLMTQRHGITCRSEREPFAR